MRNRQLYISRGGSCTVQKKSGDLVTLEGPSVVLDEAGTKNRDLSGEYFSDETYFGANMGDGMDSLFHHGIPVSSKAFAQNLADHVFPTVKARKSDSESAIIAQVVYDMRNEYERFVIEQAESKSEKGSPLLGWSTGAGGYQADDDGHIKRWLIVEHSPTPQPAEPRTSALVMPIKSLILPVKALSLSGQVNDVHRAFYGQFDDQGWVAEVFDEYVIAEIDGKYFKIEYTNTNGEIAFGSERTPVSEIRNWVEAKAFYHSTIKQHTPEDLSLTLLALELQNKNYAIV